MWTKRWVRALTLPMCMLLLLTSCGGDDPWWNYPLWVPTDVQVSDIDGDGVNDIVEFFTPQSTDHQARITTLVQDPAGNGFTKVDSSLAGIRGIDGAVVADLDPGLRFYSKHIRCG